MPLPRLNFKFEPQPNLNLSPRLTLCQTSEPTPKPCTPVLRSVSWMAGSAATKLCSGELPIGEPPAGDESPAADPCQLSFEMPCNSRTLV